MGITCGPSIELLRPEEHKFKTSLGYTARLSFKNNKEKGWVYSPIERIFT